MNIAIVTAYYQPKLGYQQYFLAKAFEKLGHTCTIVTSDRFFPFPSYEKSFQKVLGNRIVSPGVFKERGIKTIRLKTSVEVASNATLVFQGLNSTIKSLDPDIVIGCNAFTPAGFQIAHAVSKLKVKPFLILDSHAATFNSSVDDSLVKKVYFRFFTMFLKGTILKNTDFFAPIGDSEGLLLKKALGNDIRSIVIPLGADTDSFTKDNASRLSIRKKYKVSNKEVLFIYAGKISEEKDVHVLIKAFAKAANKIDNLRLVLIGNGSSEYMHVLKKIISDNKHISKKVSFIPFVKNNDLANYYNAADIGVWPGNLSITIQEAMATGLPVILPKSISEGQTSDHLAKNKAAIQFERGNILDLSKKMIRLVEDTKERNTRSKNCYNLIRKTCSWDVIAQQYLDLYTQNRKQK